MSNINLKSNNSEFKSNTDNDSELPVKLVKRPIRKMPKLSRQEIEKRN